MIQSVKKLKNVFIYENSASYPWARLKDLILCEDGKTIEKILIASESIIPVFYVVSFSDLEVISKEKIVLKQKTVPTPCRAQNNGKISFLNLRKTKIVEAGRKKKLTDVNFDVEIGEISDFIFSDFPIGKKHYSSPEDSMVKNLISQHLKNIVTEKI